MHAPRVIIVVLNWNRKYDTIQCLRSLSRLNYPNYSIILVDNGSGDGSVSAVASEFPHVEIIETGENLGYAGGNNIGIEQGFKLGADYVCVLNNDTTMAPDALTHAVTVAEGLNGRAGVVGFTVWRTDRPDVLSNAGINVDEFLHGEGFHVPSTAELASAESIPVTSAHGSAMLLSRRMYYRVGGLEEAFFLMHEEADLCARARHAGFTVVVATRARVWHTGSATFGKDSALKRFYDWRNRPLYVSRRLREANRLNEYGNYLMRYRDAAREEVRRCVHRFELSMAYAVLAAVGCAERQRWGRRVLPWYLAVGFTAQILAMLVRVQLGKLRSAPRRVIAALRRTSRT